MALECDQIKQPQLKLLKIGFAENVELDTFENYNNAAVMLVGVIHNGHLGNFLEYCGFVRNFKNITVLYQFDGLTDFKISSTYIAPVNSQWYGKNNWGWFFKSANGIENKLPDEDRITDSLQHQYPGYFVRLNKGGEIFIFKNGQFIKYLNYGNIVLGDSTIQFDKLPSGLYTIDKGRLLKKDNDPDRSINHVSGLFFVGRPGLGTESLFNINDIVNKLMRFKTAADCPSEILITGQSFSKK